MAELNFQRCRNHPEREAVARCPQCGHFFCRECVTEHEDRMLCSACLTDLIGAGARRRPLRWAWFSTLLIQGGLGFLLMWCVFFLIGRILLAIPYSFHEGTIWQTPWWQAP